MYDSGRGVPKDPATAVKYYQEAAAKDDGSAILRLAQFYETGNGVPQDFASSMKWYMKLANKYAEAQYKIGYFYEHGYGVQADRTKSLDWYHKASSHGSVEAMLRIKELEK
jgi:TPR repeat protein